MLRRHLDLNGHLSQHQIGVGHSTSRNNIRLLGSSCHLTKLLTREKITEQNSTNDEFHAEVQLNQRTKTAWFSGPSLKQTFGFEQFQSPNRGAIVDHETKISLSFRHIIIIIFHCVHAQQAVKQ